MASKIKELMLDIQAENCPAPQFIDFLHEAIKDIPEVNRLEGVTLEYRVRENYRCCEIYFWQPSNHFIIEYYYGTFTVKEVLDFCVSNLPEMLKNNGYKKRMSEFKISETHPIVTILQDLPF